jgi:hypothetical protein
MDFEQFTKSPLPNAWIVENNILRLYIRKTYPLLKSHYGDYQLASMVSAAPGSGLLTTFLNKYEPKYQFYIENIFEERFFEYFKGRGYRVMYNHMPYCVLGPMPTEIK